MVQCMTTRLLEKLTTETSPSQVAMLGLKKLTDETVVVVINELPVTVCLAEHFCCTQLYILERETGGTKGSSANPKLTSPHCHPIPHTDFMTQEASTALSTYRKIVESGEWNTCQSYRGEENSDMDKACEKEDSDRTESDANSDSDRTESDEETTHEKKKRKHTNNDLSVSLAPVSNRSPCNLMLAMIYGEYDGSPETIGNMKVGTPQLRRDTARCISTEAYACKEVYTLDNREGAGIAFRSDRHMVQNLTNINLLDPLMMKIVGRVSQICLDYFWFVSRYWDIRLGAPFFTQSLPKLHCLLLPGGSIYIGLSVHLILRVLANQSGLEEHFLISLVHETEVEEIDLVKGSHLIPADIYANTKQFCGKDQKPEEERGTSIEEIRQTYQGQAGNKRDVIASFLKVADGKNPKECRFIKLEKLKE